MRRANRPVRAATSCACFRRQVQPVSEQAAPAPALEPREATAHVARLIGDRPELRLSGLWPQDPENDRALGVIHGNVCDLP